MCVCASGTSGSGTPRQNQPVGPPHGDHGPPWCGEDGAVVGRGEAVRREEALPVSGGGGGGGDVSRVKTFVKMCNMCGCCFFRVLLKTMFVLVVVVVVVVVVVGRLGPGARNDGDEHDCA